VRRTCRCRRGVRGGDVQGPRRVVHIVGVDAVRVLLVMGDVAGGDAVIAGVVLATETDALFTAVAEAAGAIHKAADMLVGSSVVGRPNRWKKLVVRFTTVSLGARRW